MKRMILTALLVLAAGTASGQEIPIGQVRFVGGPDISTFAQTTSVTVVAVGGNGTNLTFDKKDGPNRWPDKITPGWSGALQYSTGLCEQINGQWVCSAPIESWYGRQDATGPIQTQSTPTCAAGQGQIQCNWFYDNRWAPLNGHRPQPGETLGIFVVAGDARNSYNPIPERSNIVTFQLPAEGQTQTFYYNAVVPQPTPAPPAPTPTPVPTPTPTPPPPTPAPAPAPVPSSLCDAACMSNILAQLNALKTDLDASRAENQQFYTQVKSTWDTISPVVMPLLKYVVPAVTAYLAGKHL